MKKIGIIGGGAAGMAAAVFAAEAGAEVHLFDHNEKLGKKLFITGKGRCNFTNDCPPEELLNNVVTNPKFMLSSFGRWNSQQTIDFFERLGCRTKVERGNRAFPASDHSSDIIRALERRMKDLGVKIHLRSEVQDILCEETASDSVNPEGDVPAGDASSDGSAGKKHGKKKERLPQKKVCGILLANGAKLSFDAVLLATGGLSYPSTGSTGEGYRMAEKSGHRITERRPALVPLVTEEPYVRELQGLSLRNVTLTIPYGRKKKFEELGEMLFTHFGITGPLVLSASSVIGASLEEGPLKGSIDLKPALTREQLDARILREFDGAKNKEFKNAIGSLFPAKMRPVMVELSGIPGEKPVNEITKKERTHFLEMIKAFPLTITGTRDFNEAIITQGGINVHDVNPSTMESKKVQNLYFAGEVLDVDAFTGGFNLQEAWATAHTAAEAMTEEMR